MKTLLAIETITICSCLDLSDINECSRPEDNDCNDINGTCLNNDGSYTCDCKSGFRGDGKTCIGE